MKLILAAWSTLNADNRGDCGRNKYSGWVLLVGKKRRGQLKENVELSLCFENDKYSVFCFYS